MTEVTIFTAALEKKNPAQRQAFLDQACAGNSQLRAAVEELLKADSDAGSFLEHPPAGIDATVASDPNSRDTANDGGWIRSLAFLQPCDKPDRIGRLDKYEIIEVVGHGGMGAVLRAFDTKLSRVVAVKVMSPTLAANATAVKRFLREATTAAQVHHDHVVTIHEVDDSHRPPYLVMEFVEGQTLQQKIDRQGALDLVTILRIGSQAAAGLAASHKLGLIHRDVKPANILLENGVERVKITDFGLARAADDVQMTQTGIIAGTPQYMSPEQAKGEPIDAKSDLFSLGSVLYTMSTGRPAFRADNPVAVLRRVCDDTPRPIREVNPEIPDWLDAIVTKLLAKDPADRFQSAAEVAELLSQHLAHVQNPAIAPQPARVFPSPQLTSIAGLWRDGNLLVMHKHARLPDVCLKSNTNATHRLKRRLAWHHPALYLVLLINPLIYLVLALVIQRSATIHVPLAHEWFLRRRQRMAFAWGSVVAGLALLVATVTGNGIRDVLMFPLIALAAFLFLGGIAFGLVGCRLVWAQRMTDDHVWLQGVHPKFLERLEQWGAVSDGSKAVPQKTVYHPAAAAKGMLRAHGIVVEHPVLGVIAVLLLLIAVGAATFMLTAAAYRSLGRSTIAPAASSADAPVWQPPDNPDPQAIFTEAEAANQTGWVSLFNGQDLTGWKTHPGQPGFWKVEEGHLVGFGAASHLFSDRGDYQDFHLRAEAQVNDGGSSGIYFRVPEFAVGRYGQFPDGYEANINSTCTSDADKTGSLTGSLRGVARYREALHKPDEWFTLEVIARGPQIVMKVNGQTTVDFVDANNTFRRGHFALQVWPAQTVVRFRKIEVRELLSAEEEKGASATIPAAPDPEMVQALRDLVAAKDRSRQTAQARFEGLRATRMELLAAEIEHVEAQIRLAQAQRQSADVVTLLKDLVAHRQEERELIEARVKGLVATPDELDQADARLADTKARLAEASP